jgi:hypothetical protein
MLLAPSCTVALLTSVLTIPPPLAFSCRARALAREQGDLALAALSCLPDTPSKRSLELMVDLVLERLY